MKVNQSIWQTSQTKEWEEDNKEHLCQSIKSSRKDSSRVHQRMQEITFNQRWQETLKSGLKDNCESGRENSKDHQVMELIILKKKVA